MSSGLIQNPLDDSTKNFKENTKKIKSKKSKSENKENIQNNIIPQKLIEEEELKSSKKSKENNSKSLYNKIKKNIAKREKEKYDEKMKENTMRDELDKISNETERLKQEYEEKNSKYYLFKNPQFRKFIKNVEIKLFYLLLSLSCLLTIFSITFIFSSVKGIEGIPIAALIITILFFSDNISLIACVKMGLLNDAELSKAFRIFVVFGVLLLITSTCFNFCSIFLYNKKISNKFWIFALLILIILDLIFVIKKCLNLFIETIMILLGKKTEYSVLISREKHSDNRNNTSLNFSLNKTNSDFLDENKNKIEEDEIDESFKNFNYFNKFHYSVSCDRKNDYIFDHFKK